MKNFLKKKKEKYFYNKKSKNTQKTYLNITRKQIYQKFL
jgi:hypothetical protein